MNFIMQRIKQLRLLLKQENEAVLITSDVNRYYFSDFVSSAGALLITPEKSYLFVDFRYAEAAQKNPNAFEVIVYTDYFNDLKEIIKKNSTNYLYIESSQMSVSYYRKLSYVLSACSVRLIANRALDLVIENIRMIKSELEIKNILQAQKITEKSYTEVLNYIRPGVSERKIAIELECLILKNGGQGTAFDLITISGKNTSLPHGVPDDNIIKDGDFFTMDIGSRYNGYNSDMTRTVAVGNISQEKQQVYEIVLSAQKTALDKVKSGVVASDIDLAARTVIAQNGYKDYFGHSTGHGVGLNIHEKPAISPKGNTILSKNMIITIEPGIYLPNKFGVRIEDMVCVKENGYVNFASVSKKLLVL